MPPSGLCVYVAQTSLPMRTSLSSKHLLFSGLLFCFVGGLLTMSHDYETKHLRLVSGQVEASAACPLLGTPMPMTAYPSYSRPAHPVTAANAQPVPEDAENRVNWLQLVTEHALRTLRFPIGGTAR